MKRWLGSLLPHAAIAAALFIPALWPLFHLRGVHAQTNLTPPPTEQSNGKNAYWASNTTIKVWIGAGFTTGEVNDISITTLV
ncbi:MAG TPA: hypothetical protein VFA60_11230 [Terriglobales bacterium]|nr:hypothetical protein [Terriglobales bacterium]